MSEDKAKQMNVRCIRCPVEQNQIKIKVKYRQTDKQIDR